MAGLVALYDMDSSPNLRSENFQKICNLTCRFKELPIPENKAVGQNCIAAKIDASSSLHRGIVRDEITGSWIFAAGTVVALEGNNDPIKSLKDLLRGYLEVGIKVLDKYDGHFGLVIYNGREKSLTIITDPLGLFAIYYTKNDQQFLISTSALAIAKLIKSKIDVLVADCFLRSGRSFGEKTLWKDVNRIRPAICMKWTPEKFEEKEYWKPTVDENISHLNMKDALNVADEKISRIFNRSLLREGKVWADLTGGYDTRVTTMYLDKLRIPFIAYCVDPAGHPDLEISHLISKEMGWDYRPMELPQNWQEEQLNWLNLALGRGDGLLNIFQLSGVLKLAEDRALMAKVSVPGTGVDEWRYHIFRANTLFASAVSKVDFDAILDAKIIDNVPQDFMSLDHSIETRKIIKDYLHNETKKYINDSKITQIDIAFLRYRHPIHSGAYLSSQSAVIRSIIPFCFKELVNFGFSINHQWRISYHSRFVSAMMEKQNFKLANIRTEKGGPFLPIRLTNVHKFIPLGIYLADHLLGKFSYKLVKRRMTISKKQIYPRYPLEEWKKKWIRWALEENLLSTDKMLSGQLYNPDKFVELVNLGLNGRQTYSLFLDRIVTLEMALRATNAKVDQVK